MTPLPHTPVGEASRQEKDFDWDRMGSEAIDKPPTVYQLAAMSTPPGTDYILTGVEPAQFMVRTSSLRVQEDCKSGPKIPPDAVFLLPSSGI